MEQIHYSFDLVRLGGLAARISDDGGAFDLDLASGELAHTDMASAVDHRGNTPSRLASIQVFAAVLQAALNAGTAGAGAYTVAWDPETFYTVTYSAGAFSMDFRSATIGAGGPRAASALGFTSGALISGSSSYASSVRPFYLLIPAAMGRTGVSPDRADSGVATDAATDGGVYGQTSRSSVAINKEWVQAGEDETVIGAVAYDEPGTAVHAYKATAAAPWSYQHAWDHALSYKCAIKVIDDTDGSYAELCEMRADGLSFAPRYTGPDDYAMYSIEFKTRLLGRIS